MRKLKEKTSYAYPPVGCWRKADPKFQWIKLKYDELTVMEDDYALFLIVSYRGVLRSHRFIPNAPRPEGYSLVWREKYPSVENWNDARKQSISLENGEYTIIFSPRGVPLYLLAKLRDVVKIHPYLEHGKFDEDFRFIPFRELRLDLV